MKQDPAAGLTVGQQQATPLDGFVRVGPLAGIPALVRELGGDPEPLLAGAGFGLTQFEDPDTPISYNAAARLVARCVAATRCEHFGLLLGRRSGPSTLGLTGFILRTAPDVRTALRALVSHLDLHDQGGSVSLFTHGQISYFGYAIHAPQVEAADQIYDLSLAIACNTMRSLCGDTWYPTEIFLPRRQPEDVTPYKAFFRARLHFDADRASLAFATRWLDHPLPGADPLLHHHLQRDASRLHSSQHLSVAAKVRRMLRASLGKQECTANDIARLLGMHERTLNRRLRDAGTTFRRERAEVRYEIARQLLADTAMPLSKIAEALDYADATAFSRAFRRWSGDAPARWRERVAPSR